MKNIVYKSTDINFKYHDNLPPSKSFAESVTFKLYSTKFPGKKGLKDWKWAGDAEEDILYNEKNNTASLISGTMFDPKLKTIVTAHGNGGGHKISRQMWKHYCEVANQREHYNVIGNCKTLQEFWPTLPCSG